MGRVILFDSVKGGVGKSTLLAQFTVYLAAEYKVAVMDCDPQGSVNRWVARRFSNENFEQNFALLKSDVDTLKDEKKNYDFILVDSAGADTETGRLLLLSADIVISPFQPTRVAIDTVPKYSMVLTEARKHNHSLKAFYVLNDCSVHNKDREALDTLEALKEYKESKNLDVNIIEQFIFSRKILKTSFGDGSTCFDGRNNKSRNEIEQVAKIIF